MPNTPDRAAHRVARGYAQLGWLALAYTAFAVSGSLVPLDFQPRPLTDAIDTFRNIQTLRLGLGSRADWVSNILLFVPLAFLWTGTCWSRRSVLWNCFASLLVFASATALSVGIEFVQLYFPPRTVSMNDLRAEAIGAGVGVAAWWAFGSRLIDWWRTWRSDDVPANRWTRILYVYLALLLGYSLLPLDITISPIEIYHKWREGRVVLIPFAFAFAHPSEAAYGLLTDVAIWCPVAALWPFAFQRRRLPGWFAVALVATVIELAQLTIYSRVSDITDILTATLGAVIGAWLGTRAFGRGPQAETRETSEASSHGLWLFLALAWVVVLIAVFWYPFNFNADRAFLIARFRDLDRSPLEIYYYGTEFRAVTEVLHKIGFFLPLGVFAGLALSGLKHVVARRLGAWLAILAVIACAAGIEAGQLLLPTKYADATDWLLESVGALIGYFGILKFTRRPPERPSRHLRASHRAHRRY